MEATADKSTSHTEDVRHKIAEAYREYLLLHGKNPESVFAFCKELGIGEEEFYAHFSDFQQIADNFWADLFEETRQALEGSEEYAEFAARDKFLSFYFSFFENLKKHRSYALKSLEGFSIRSATDRQVMKKLKSYFKAWAKQVVIEGKNSGEISGRSKISDAYDDMLWFQFMFLMDFWKKDRSRGFERTDEAIEKSVNLGFDLMEKNAIDSAFDFGKFIFQNR